jgi:hypothetical protein
MLPARALLVPLCAHSGGALIMVNIRQKARAVLAILLSVIGESPVFRSARKGCLGRCDESSASTGHHEF